MRCFPYYPFRPGTDVCTEIAFVGKAAGTYAMHLGGGYYGQRLNKIYRGAYTLHPPLCPASTF